MQPSLDALYASSLDTSFLHPLPHVEGLIMGACASPEIPLPDQWLPWTIKIPAKVEDNAHADRLFVHLFDFFREVLGLMRQGSVSLPRYINSTNILENYPMQQFFSGMLFAHQASEPVWQRAWKLMQDQDPAAEQENNKGLKHCLLMFSTFADPHRAIQRAQTAGKAEFADKLPLIAKSLSDAFNTYIRISGQLVSYLPEQFETNQC